MSGNSDFVPSLWRRSGDSSFIKEMLSTFDYHPVTSTSVLGKMMDPILIIQRSSAVRTIYCMGDDENYLRAEQRDGYGQT